METSKKITWTFIVFYILQVIATMFINIKYKYDVSPILNYTTPLVSIILISYFGKAGVENYTKINNNTLCQSTQTNSTSTNGIDLQSLAEQMENILQTITNNKTTATSNATESTTANTTTTTIDTTAQSTATGTTNSTY